MSPGDSRWGRLLLSLLFVSVVAACSVNTGRILPEVEPVAGDASALEAEALQAWEPEPREADSVQRAFETMMDAWRATPAADPGRFRRLASAARFAAWLGRRGPEESYADTALVLSNTLVREDSARVEGYYYRALAAAAIGRQDRMRGRSAMGVIRRNARRAIDLDPDYDNAGPHRVLGALFLRAPGPPAGVGSLRRALSHLEEAVARAPEAPANHLLLAEAYLEDDRKDKAHVHLDDTARLLQGRPDDDRNVVLLRELRHRAGG